MPKTNLTILNNLLNFEAMKQTHSLSFDWNYGGKARFKVFAEYAVFQGDIICTFEAVPGDLAATMVRLTNPNFEQEAHDECISQYHAYLTDAAIYKIDQP